MHGAPSIEYQGKNGENGQRPTTPKGRVWVDKKGKARLRLKKTKRDYVRGLLTDLYHKKEKLKKGVERTI